MTEFLNVLTAFGISAPAGLNAYMPLFLVGLVARFTNLIKLQQPFDMLANEWVLGVLGILVLVELFVDKIPGLDHVNDVIGTFVRPAAGAVLFASTSNVVTDMHPAFALICGIVAAGGVHAVKATTRPVVTTLTAGMGNPVVSIVEDIVAFVAVLAAIITPILVLVFLAFTVAFITWFVLRRRSRKQAALAA